MTMTAQSIAKLNVLNWNADGLKHNIPELEDFMIRHNIHIALISETHLKPEISIKIKNYSIYRTDRTSRFAAGGTAVIVSNQIAHSKVNLELQTLEATAVNIVLGQGRKLQLSATYNKPSNELLYQDLQNILNTGEPTLLAGDLNSKNQEWGCTSTNPNGKRLLEFLKDEPWLLLTPDEPTRLPPQANHAPDILDIVMVNNLDYDIKQKVMNKLSSDHLPVLISNLHQHQ